MTDPTPYLTGFQNLGTLDLIKVHFTQESLKKLLSTVSGISELRIGSPDTSDCLLGLENTIINVNSLELYDCDINEKVIDSFSQSLFLKKIELSYCRLEKYALKRGSLKNLTALEFDEGDIEDALDYVHFLKNLKSLSIRGCLHQALPRQFLSRMTNLKRLTFKGSLKVTEKMFDNFSISRLKVLDLTDDTEIDFNLSNFLAEGKNLKSLYLSNTRISTENLSKCSFPRLEMLDVSKCRRIDRDLIPWIQKNFPHYFKKTLGKKFVIPCRDITELKKGLEELGVKFSDYY